MNNLDPKEAQLQDDAAIKEQAAMGENENAEQAKEEKVEGEGALVD